MRVLGRTLGIVKHYYCILGPAINIEGPQMDLAKKKMPGSATGDKAAVGGMNFQRATRFLSVIFYIIFITSVLFRLNQCTKKTAFAGALNLIF